MSQNPSLFRAFATVGSYTMLSRVTGFVRDTLMATFIGAGATADAFVMAFTLPNLFRSLFAEGAFSAGFVPIFAQTLERDGRASAKHFADEAFAVLTVVLVGFCALAMIFMPLVIHVVAIGFARMPGQMDRTVELARIMFPYLLFVSLTSLQSGVLNAIGRFAVPAAAPVLANLTFIAALLAGVGADGDRAVFLSWGVSIAGVVQFTWLAVDCHRAGVGFKFVRPRFTPDIKRLLMRVVPVAFGAGVYQVNVVVNRTIASMVGTGAVSWIYYADRVTQLPVGIFGAAIGTALLPLLTRHIQAGNETSALHDQNRAIEISLLLTIPAAAGIVMLAAPITSVLFEHGEFTPIYREKVAAALVVFAIGLPAYVLNKALTPGFFGRHDTRTPVIASTIALAVNILLNVALMSRLGHVGIALGTTVSAWLNVAQLSFILHRRGHLKPDQRLVRRLPRIIVAAVAMTAGVGATNAVVAAHFGPIFGAHDMPSGPAVLRSLVLFAIIGVGVFVFGATAFVVGAVVKSDLDLFRSRRKPKSEALADSA